MKKKPPIKKPIKKDSRSKVRGYLDSRRGCFFCKNTTAIIDYKDAECLKDFITRSGKILPRRISGTCAKHQHLIAREIMKARMMSLLPYTRKY